MGIHAAGTQHGLSYHLAPLQGARAPILTALLSRAPAAHVQFRPLQQLIWQIEGGLSYSEMPAQSQQLIDQLVPEYRGELRADFVTELQKKANSTGSAINQIIKVFGVQINTQAINALLQRYQTSRQILLQNVNNYEAIAQNFVHIVPGTAPSAGPASWSRLNSRVYARITGGNVYGENATLQVRALPTSNRGSASVLRRSHLRIASYSPSGGARQSTLANDLVAVPLGPIIAYPNSAPSMQGLAGVLNPNGGLVIELEILNSELVPIQNGLTNLMWIDCAPGSTADAVAYVLEPNFPEAAQATGWAATFDDIYSAAVQALADGGAASVASLEAAGFTLVAFDELEKQGISCSNHNFIKAIEQAANDYRAAPRSTSIIAGSVSFETGLIAARANADGPSGLGAINIRLGVIQCGESSNCRSPLTPGAVAPWGFPLKSPAMRPLTAARQSSPTGKFAVTLLLQPATVWTGGQTVLSGTARGKEGELLSKARLELAATEGSAQAAPMSVTTGADGSFLLNFTAPPTPGVVTITAHIVGMPNSPVAAATLRVVPRR